MDNFLKTVFFIFMFDENDKEVMIGTGFIVSYKAEYSKKLRSIYFVTAKHVIENAKNAQKRRGLQTGIFIRVNLKTGRSKRFRTNPEDWMYDETDPSIDIALFHGNSGINNLDAAAIDANMAVTKEMLKDRSVAEGDEIFMVGLFHLHAGIVKNQPIVRTGNIAALPKERVKSTQFGSIEAHLIEARSMGGLSGSPVFVYTGQRGINEDFMVTDREIKWLGVAQGHWDAYGKDNLSVNMGIGLVVPANKVTSILKSPKIKSKRTQKKDNA